MNKWISLAVLLLWSTAAFAQVDAARFEAVAKTWDRSSANPNSVDLRLQRPYDRFEIMVTPGMIYVYGVPTNSQFPGTLYIVGIRESVLNAAKIELRQGENPWQGALVDAQSSGATISTDAFVEGLRQAALALDALDRQERVKKIIQP
jgi:hypothetical protein